MSYEFSVPAEGREATVGSLQPLDAIPHVLALSGYIRKPEKKKLYKETFLTKKRSLRGKRAETKRTF